MLLQNIAPTLHALAVEFKDLVQVVKVDVDAAQALTQREQVSAMPTFKGLFTERGG